MNNTKSKIELILDLLSLSLNNGQLGQYPTVIQLPFNYNKELAIIQLLQLKYPVLKNIQYELYPDTNYVASDYDYGNIEYMPKGTDKIEYVPGVYSYTSPNPNANSIVYNPNRIDHRDLNETIALDAISYGLHDDSTYSALHLLLADQYPSDAALNAAYEYMLYNADSDEARLKIKDDFDNRRNTKLLHDLFELERKNPDSELIKEYYYPLIDGMVRNYIFLKNHPDKNDDAYNRINYYNNFIEDLELYETGKANLYMNDIYNYVTTGKRPSYILPEVTVNNHADGGNLFDDGGYTNNGLPIDLNSLNNQELDNLAELTLKRYMETYENPTYAKVLEDNPGIFYSNRAKDLNSYHSTIFDLPDSKFKNNLLENIQLKVRDADIATEESLHPNTTDLANSIFSNELLPIYKLIDDRSFADSTYNIQRLKVNNFINDHVTAPTSRNYSDTSIGNAMEAAEKLDNFRKAPVVMIDDNTAVKMKSLPEVEVVAKTKSDLLEPYLVLGILGNLFMKIFGERDLDKDTLDLLKQNISLFMDDYFDRLNISESDKVRLKNIYRNTSIKKFLESPLNSNLAGYYMKGINKVALEESLLNDNNYSLNYSLKEILIHELGHMLRNTLSLLSNRNKYGFTEDEAKLMEEAYPKEALVNPYILPYNVEQERQSVHPWTRASIINGIWRKDSNAPYISNEIISGDIKDASYERLYEALSGSSYINRDYYRPWSPVAYSLRNKWYYDIPEDIKNLEEDALYNYKKQLLLQFLDENKNLINSDNLSTLKELMDNAKNLTDLDRIQIKLTEYLNNYYLQTPEGKEKLNRLDKVREALIKVAQNNLSLENTVGINVAASGGDIHIKPSHEGRLTDYLKRTGKTEAEAYETGGPEVRKMITFARNARKWKHDDGGNLIQEAIRDRAYRNITPYSYSVSDALKDFIVSPSARNIVDPISEALWAKYLGRSRYFNSGNYQPEDGLETASSTDNVDEVLQNSLYLPSPLEHEIPNTTLAVKPFRNYFTLSDLDYENPLSDIGFNRRVLDLQDKIDFGELPTQLEENTPFGHYNIYLGNDDNGQYLAYYDSYNINPFKGSYGNVNSTLSTILPSSITDKEDISSNIGTPFGLYDRRYFNLDDLDLALINERASNDKVNYEKAEYEDLEEMNQHPGALSHLLDRDDIVFGLTLLPEVTITPLSTTISKSKKLGDTSSTSGTKTSYLNKIGTKPSQLFSNNNVRS